MTDLEPLLREIIAYADERPMDVRLQKMAEVARRGGQTSETSARERGLQAIGDVIAYWIKWVTREHNGDVTADTSVIFSGEGAPPVWPSVGQLQKWLEVIRSVPLDEATIPVTTLEELSRHEREG